MSFISNYPAGTQYAAILDTNVYRDLCPGETPQKIKETISDIRVAETSKGIVGVGLVIAAIELISGLVEGEGTKSYRECLSGIIAMGHHVHHHETSEPIIIPHPYLHVARSFFEVTPQDILDKVKNIGGVITDFRKDSSTALAWHTQKNTFQNVKSWLLAGEREFVDLTENLIKGSEVEVRKVYPIAADKDFRKKMAEYLAGDTFKDIVAQQIIIATGITLNIALPVDEVRSRAQALIKMWPLAVGFTTWICHIIYTRNINMHSKQSIGTRWNWIWDYQAAFMISNDTVNGRVPFIVTGDTDMGDALREHGFGNRVMTLEEYKKRLGLP